MVIVNDQPAAAFDEARRFLAQYYGEDFGRAYLDVWVVAGPPEAVATRLQAYLDAGCTIPIVRFASWQQEQQLDRFVAEVLPMLGDVSRSAQDQGEPSSGGRR